MERLPMRKVLSHKVANIETKSDPRGLGLSNLDHVEVDVLYETMDSMLKALANECSPVSLKAIMNIMKICRYAYRDTYRFVAINKLVSDGKVSAFMAKSVRYTDGIPAFDATLLYTIDPMVAISVKSKMGN